MLEVILNQTLCNYALPSDGLKITERTRADGSTYLPTPLGELAIVTTKKHVVEVAQTFLDICPLNDEFRVYR